MKFCPKKEGKLKSVTCLKFTACPCTTFFFFYYSDEHIYVVICTVEEKYKILEKKPSLYICMCFDVPHPRSRRRRRRRRDVVFVFHNMENPLRLSDVSALSQWTMMLAG